MRLKIFDIPKNELNHFIQLMDGYQGIWNLDRSWMTDEYSQPVQITLFCYLIAQGELFVQDQKLRSFDDGHEDLIQFIEGYFGNKCIVNFTDLFFLNEINQAFCDGNWYNVHPSWLAERPEVLTELTNRKPEYFRVEQAYQIIVESYESDFEDMYFLKISDDRTTLIDFFGDKIIWLERPIGISEFKRMYNVGKKHYAVHPICRDEFLSYVTDLVEPEVGSLLN